MPRPRRPNPVNQFAPAGAANPFSETGAWATVGGGWQHLHGNFRELGYSIEWHDFTAAREFDWSRSFHPGGLEICLNLAGRGSVKAPGAQLDLAPLTGGFYLQDEQHLSGVRTAGERHQFITIELSLPFLERHLAPGEKGLHARLQTLSRGGLTAQVSETIRLTTEHQQMIASLRHPPVYAAAQRLWYHAKALEAAAAFFYQPLVEDDLFCQRQKRQNQERVQKVIAVLRENLANPISLEEIGRKVGCSHFHLSRIFSQEIGKTIFQKLRELRLERAAEMLREGKLNVTQVALEVGYSSPSHFSSAFHEAFGCCPGLYPLATTSQLPVVRK
ncbi:MAG TPA: AraC family transcriptional regulator [Chthoniobacteraceae bacterium]|jgi:AraC-like DNA-binding protein|nr:Transcriptional regulator, AraC family [Chthoniobacter sp.]HEV7869615.1 AraC family transcriptional regulator [Chthoniobacteraceae bacterium]